MADFEVHIDLAGETRRIGLAKSNRVRGSETILFEYEDAWLKDPDRFSLEPALALTRGAFAPPAGLATFGSIGDSAPDIWRRRLSDMSNPTDLSLVFMKGGELDLRIEAKTVLTDKEVKSQYLGKSGLDRFEDGANPYTVQPFGGMVAYVVDLDGALWSEKIVSELKAKVGSTRLRSIVLNGGTHVVSNHAFDLSDASSVTKKEVDVVHFVIEIDAKPSRR